MDREGLIYRRSQDRHQLVVPKSLIQDVVRANHDPSYIAHPGIKRTHNVIALNYWWRAMRRTIEGYVGKCDSCQKRKGDRKSHQRNNYHDRRAKHRKFKVGDLVYLYQPARRPGLSATLFLPWTGPLHVAAKISDLDYDIQDHYAMKQIVHINRLKAAHDSTLWKPRCKQRRPVKSSRETPESDVSEGEAGLVARHIPLVQEAPKLDCRPTVPSPDTPDPSHVLDTPSSQRSDPSYFPPTTPGSRRELHATRTEPPVKRARARILLLEARHSAEQIGN